MIAETVQLTWPDITVLLALVLLMIGIGVAFGGRAASTEGFFLARRALPWWAAGLSFIATEVSAVTLISVPSVAYTENWQYAQFFIGSAAARGVQDPVFRNTIAAGSSLLEAGAKVGGSVNAARCTSGV